MKTENTNSMPIQESLLRAVDTPCDIDSNFLNRLAEQSALEFEQANTAGQSQPSGTENVWRFIMKHRITQLSSAAVILIIALVGINMLVGSGVTVTFADVIEPILKAKTLSYDFLVGGEESGIVMHDVVTESHIRRTINDTTMIIDLDNDRMLSLDHTKMEAIYMDFTGPLKEGTQLFIQFIRDTIKQLQNNPDFSPEHLGEKEINGRKAVGFSSHSPEDSWVIWADAETAVPILIELTNGHQLSVLRNIEFDIPVDASQFSMDVPNGYTFKETNLDLSSATEADFITGLKVWVEVVLDGQFPQALSSEAYMKDLTLMEEKVEALGLPADEAEEMGIAFVKGMMFINLFPVQGNSDLHYVGQDADYGDTETPIAWYRPKDSENYHVIYADLSVKEAAPDELPQ